MPIEFVSMILRSLEGEVYTYVVRGAETVCDQGSKPSKLNIPNSHGVFLKNQPQLNIMDAKPNINIMPYGKCKKLGGPCRPSTSPLSNTFKEFVIWNDMR